MRKIGLTAAAIGLVVAGLGMTLPPLFPAFGIERMLIKNRLINTLQKHGRIVVWDPPARLKELPVYFKSYVDFVGDTTRVPKESDAEFQKLVAANFSAASLIHAMELDNGETLFLLESTPSVKMDGYVRIVGGSHHQHYGRAYNVFAWGATMGGFHAEQLKNLFPFPEIGTIEEWLGETRRRFRQWTTGVGASVSVIGISGFFVSRLRVSGRRIRPGTPERKEPPASKYRRISKTTPQTRHADTVSVTDLAPLKASPVPDSGVVYPPPVQSPELKALLAQIDSLLAEAEDEFRKKIFRGIRVKLSGITAVRPGTLNYYHSQIRRLADTGSRTTAEEVGKIIPRPQEETLLGMLPIDEIVYRECPNLDPNHVKRLIIALLAPGRKWSYFGDKTLPYSTFRKVVVDVPPEKFEECYAWLVKIRVISDVKGGGAVRRRRGRDHRCCAFNLKYKEAPHSGSEILKIVLRARDQLEQRLSGKG